MDPTLENACLAQLWICITLMLPIAVVNVLLGFLRCELQFDGRRPMLVAVYGRKPDQLTMLSITN